MFGGVPDSAPFIPPAKEEGAPLLAMVMDVKSCAFLQSSINSRVGIHLFDLTASRCCPSPPRAMERPLVWIIFGQVATSVKNGRPVLL